MVFQRLFRSPTVGSIADWTSLLQLVGSVLGGGLVLSWPASSIDIVSQHGWGASFFVALAAICALIVVGSFGLIAWRLFRPLSVVGETFNNQDSSAAKQIAEGRTDDFEQSTRDTFSAIIKSLTDNDLKSDVIRSELSALGHKISAIDEILKPESEMGFLAKLGMPEMPPAINRFDSVMRSIVRSESVQVGKYNDLTESIKNIHKLIDNISAKQDDFSEYTIGMFRAERTLEAYENNSSALDEISHRLGDPNLNPEVFSQWGIWTNEFNSFKNRLRAVCNLVRPYADVQKDVFETPNHKFKSSYWTYDFSMMSDDQKHDFKTFKIIHSNYESAKEQIEGAITSARYARI